MNKPKKNQTNCIAASLTLSAHSRLANISRRQWQQTWNCKAKRVEKDWTCGPWVPQMHRCRCREIMLRWRSQQRWWDSSWTSAASRQSAGSRRQSCCPRRCIAGAQRRCSSVPDWWSSCAGSRSTASHWWSCLDWCQGLSALSLRCPSLHHLLHPHSRHVASDCLLEKARPCTSDPPWQQPCLCPGCRQSRMDSLWKWPSKIRQDSVAANIVHTHSIHSKLCPKQCHYHSNVTWFLIINICRDDIGFFLDLNEIKES